MNVFCRLVDEVVKTSHPISLFYLYFWMGKLQIAWSCCITKAVPFKEKPEAMFQKAVYKY